MKITFTGGLTVEDESPATDRLSKAIESLVRLVMGAQAYRLDEEDDDADR